MKILYLTDASVFQKSGVLNKINNQIDQWTQMGHEVYYAFFPVKYEEAGVSYITPNVKGLFYVSQKKYAWLPRVVYNYANKITSVGQYRRYIEELKPDVVYLRELVGFPGLDKIAESAKTVIESNTLMKEEMKLRRGLTSKILEIWRQKLNRKIVGVIGVTNEIVEQFDHLQIPQLVISNGIPLDITKMKELKQQSTNTSPRKKIVMVCSCLLPWHGVDKLNQMAQQMPEHDFHFIGSEQPRSLSNLFNHAYMDKAALDRFLEDADIAIGTLALHRKKMEEACPLKVREYAAFLLPMILAYKDPDFHQQEYVLEIDNTENTIIDNIGRIRKFVTEWGGKKIDPEKVYGLISAVEKEHQRISFLQKIVAS